MAHHLIPRPIIGSQRRSGAVFGVLALAAAAAGVAGAMADPAPARAASAASTLVVQADQPFRPVTHVASGGLYGLDTSSIPSDTLVEALHPNTFVQMAPGGHQLPNGEPAPGGDALVVAPEAARAGAKVVVRMPDWYPNFPYQWVSWSDWLSAVDQQVAAVKASGASDIAAWELWNEPDWTWNTAAAGAFDAGWARTYQQVRARDSRPIQGPSISYFNQSWMSTFLTDARNSGTLPDVISWHELGGSSSIAADVAAYRSLEASLGISPRPIAIEEYATTSEVGVPGPLAGYIAKFERAGVTNAELAFWNHYGTLGDTLTDTGGSPNGAYWLYAWYGAMTGNMLTTAPPSQTGIDGAASVSANGRQVSVIFGGGSGAGAVTVNGLGSAFGGTVSVTLQSTPGSGRTTPVAGPTTVSQSTYTVTNGSVTVPVSMTASSGYHLVITPGSGGGTTPPTTPPTTQPTTSAGGCAVTYTPNQWTGGFTANVTITDTGTAPVNGWTLAFTFPGDQKITNAWNASYTQSGQSVTLTNASYNATISPGGSTTVGFQGTWASSDASPTTFALNGAACS